MLNSCKELQPAWPFWRSLFTKPAAILNLLQDWGTLSNACFESYWALSSQLASPSLCFGRGAWSAEILKLFVWLFQFSKPQIFLKFLRFLTALENCFVYSVVVFFFCVCLFDWFCVLFCFFLNADYSRLPNIFRKSKPLNKALCCEQNKNNTHMCICAVPVQFSGENFAAVW